MILCVAACSDIAYTLRLCYASVCSGLAPCCDGLYALDIVADNREQYLQSGRTSNAVDKWA